jgi:hypothetical protein
MGRSGDRRRRMVIDLSSMTTLTTFVHLFQNAPNDGFSISTYPNHQTDLCSRKSFAALFAHTSSLLLLCGPFLFY